MKRQIILFIFTFILFQFPGFIHSAIPASERAALIALYNSTNGDNWINNSGWKTPPLHTDGFAMPGTEGSWYGVKVSSGNVRFLSLSNNNLNGIIPSQLSNLSHLDELFLSNNQLKGNIPHTLGNISLVVLDLSYNQLSDSIPSQLGNNDWLGELWLNNNQLSGSIPSQLGNLWDLVTLDLSHNQLSGIIPSSFTKLTYLYTLDIGYNCLSATDPTLIAWLDSRDPDWEAHQNQCNQLPAGDPFGSFDTPFNGSTVYSSIPVTGWALDDSGVDSVKIYRKEGNNMVYIGDAVFVEGARPDVTAAYPDYPNNTEAGWGYMMLTNFLPNGGNGRYVIYAKATDKEGNTVILGSKTIYCDNANAYKPFGAIDTPTQGGSASGNGFINWGWVLTPKPNMIPANGSTINVWVDGVKLGHPTYNIYRSDIASLFPGYANSNGAAGYFDIDTTSYDNGVHTIQWTATDSGGNTDGIGSRYFTIQNTGSSRSSSVVTKNSFAPGYKDLINIPISYDEPVKFKKVDTDSDLLENIFPDIDGNIHIQCKELERIDIHVSQAGIEVEGYIMVGNRLVSLPLGSTLEKMGGRLRWIPGPGFVGTYWLVFVETNQFGEKSRKNVLVTIVPKFSRE